MPDTLMGLMWDRTKARARLWYEVFYASANEYGVDRVSRMSAAVAYRTIFALAPLFLIAVGILGAVIRDDVAAQQQVLDAIERFAGPQVANALQPFLLSMADLGDAAALLGLLLLFWTVSSLFLEVQNDLNDIFHVPYEHTAGVVGFIRKRGIGFLWAIGLGVALIAVWFLNVIWQFLEGVLEDAGVGALHALVSTLAPLVSLLLLPVLFVLLFQTMSFINVRWGALWFGAIFTSIGFLLGAYLTGLYFAWSEDTSALTVAGSLFVLLLMAYVLAGVFLFGGVVTKVYHDYLTEGDVQSPTRRAATLPGPTEVVVAEPPEPVPVAAVLGFLGGLFVGWRRRRG